MRGIGAIDDKMAPVFDELDISKDEGTVEEVFGRIKEYKYEVSENTVKFNSMSEEIKSSIFLKTIRLTSLPLNT